MTKPPFPSITGPSVFSKDPDFNGLHHGRSESLRARKNTTGEGWGDGNMGPLTPGKKQRISLEPRPPFFYSKAKK